MPSVAVAPSQAIDCGSPFVDGDDARSRRAAMNSEEPGDRDDVVHDRRPRERSEDAARVERLADEGVEAVEEDLRQAPVGERRRERHAGPSPPKRRRTAAPGSGASIIARAGRGEQHDGAEREQLRDEGAAAVGVRADLDDLRHDHGGQDAGGDDRVDVVRQLVGDGEGVARAAADRPDRGDEHDGAQQAGHAGDDRAGPDDDAGAAEATHRPCSLTRRSAAGGGVSAPPRHPPSSPDGGSAPCARRRASGTPR